MSKIGYFLLIIVAFFQLNSTYAQINSNFIKHLSENGLKIEHETYLNSFTRSSDTLHYYKAKFHLQYGNDDAFFTELSNCSSLFFGDSLAVGYSNLHFINRDRYLSSSWFSKSKSQHQTQDELSSLYWAIENPKNYIVSELPSFIREDFLRYQKAERKKPLLAATFSSIIPGTGKLYIGSYRSFFQTLLYMTLSGWQTYESYRSLGLKHPLTIVNGGLFTTFYVVNVFGSFRETKTKKREIRNQLLFDAHTHYRLRNPFPLY